MGQTLSNGLVVCCGENDKTGSGSRNDLMFSNIADGSLQVDVASGCEKDQVPANQEAVTESLALGPIDSSLSAGKSNSHESPIHLASSIAAGSPGSPNAEDVTRVPSLYIECVEAPIDDDAEDLEDLPMMVGRRTTIAFVPGSVDSGLWGVKEYRCTGKTRCKLEPEWQVVRGTIADARAKILEDPQTYEGLWYQRNQLQKAPGKQKYKLLLRGHLTHFSIQKDEEGSFIFVKTVYVNFNKDVKPQPDRHKQLLSYQGRRVEDLASPGRGQGIADLPNVKLIGQVAPHDIFQGRVGDCWLLAAISAMAEYPEVIRHLFRNTSNLEKRPLDSFNKYTVSLCDLPSGKHVDVVVDERLCCVSKGELLGCAPSSDGELWCPYIEKSVAAHCGGWDMIQGGTPTHAWALLTGSKHQLTFCLDESRRAFKCFGLWDPNKKAWMSMGNSPKDGAGIFPNAWPDVGGGGDKDQEVSTDDMLLRMSAWKSQHYLIACNTKGTPHKHSTSGMVDNHAYTVLDCRGNVAGTGIDMIKVRNPWGKGELVKGNWSDDSSNWDKYPGIKRDLGASSENDGIFWMDKDEFFMYFKTVYLCAVDMVQLVRTKAGRKSSGRRFFGLF